MVGWYHSHPGFGCWLSSVDINTQQSFEQLTPRAVAVVVDPIQSVKGKVVIDAFRLINPQTLMMGQEPRQTTSNVGHLNKPSIQALIHGLNRHYYSIGINYRKTGLEENMLMNLHKQVWTEALQMDDFRQEGELNRERLKKLVGLAEGYEKRVKEETELTKEQLKTRYVGKVDPKKRKPRDPPNHWTTLPFCSLGLTCSCYRSRRRRPTTHRRQYCFRLPSNDRQRSHSSQSKRRISRSHKRRHGYRRRAIAMLPYKTSHSKNDWGEGWVRGVEHHLCIINNSGFLLWDYRCEPVRCIFPA